MDWMQELIRLGPALREAGVLKLGDGDKWVELAPPPPPPLPDQEPEEPPVRLRAYDAPGSRQK